MKVLVLNGSPHEDGNTVAMIGAFAKGAESNGHEVTVFDVAKKKIAGCMACEYCHTTGGGECIQKDDMQELYPLLDAADVLVLASPIYYFGLSGQLQCAIHRFYSRGVLQNISQIAMLVSSSSPSVYDGAIFEYKTIAGFMGLVDLGFVTANGDENKSEAKLAECEALGKTI